MKWKHQKQLMLENFSVMRAKAYCFKLNYEKNLREKILKRAALRNVKIDMYLDCLYI